jgi:hypothetical protein
MNRECELNPTNEELTIEELTGQELKLCAEKKTGGALPSRRFRGVMVVVGLVGLMLLLGGCGSNQELACQPSMGGAGCNNPVGPIQDTTNTGMPWYVNWAYEIMKGPIVQLAKAAVQLGVSAFWALFDNLGSTNFTGCVNGSSGPGPTCTAASVFSQMRTLALILLPLLLTWKIFKSYFIGGLIPSMFESGVSFITKFGIAVLVLSQLESIITDAFGLSNAAFNAILGNPTDLNQLSRNIAASGTGLDLVNSPGLLFVLLAICVLVSLAFILMGLLFMLRTIMVFILLVLSPFAIMASLSDEFKLWFYKWLNAMQAMLIAPIPAAVCFRLVNAYVNTVPSPNVDPAAFFLRMLYVASFLFIGGILMFKIAGHVGEMMFGLVVGALGALTGYVAGGFLVAAGSASSSSSNSTNKNNKAEVGNGLNSGGTPTTTSPVSGEGTGSAPNRGVSLPTYAYSGTAYNNGVDLQQRQQSEQMTRALRTLSESIAAGRHEAALSKLYGNGSASVNRASSVGYNYLADRNLQSLLHAAGRAAEIDAPRVSFAPVPGTLAKPVSPGEEVEPPREPEASEPVPPQSQSEERLLVAGPVTNGQLPAYQVQYLPINQPPFYLSGSANGRPLPPLPPSSASNGRTPLPPPSPSSSPVSSAALPAAGAGQSRFGPGGGEGSSTQPYPALPSPNPLEVGTVDNGPVVTGSVLTDPYGQDWKWPEGQVEIEEAQWRSLPNETLTPVPTEPRPAQNESNEEHWFGATASSGASASSGEAGDDDTNWLVPLPKAAN